MLLAPEHPKVQNPDDNRAPHQGVQTSRKCIGNSGKAEQGRHTAMWTTQRRTGADLDNIYTRSKTNYKAPKMHAFQNKTVSN